MEKSFASLLRHSKLASYDRRLSQVYTTPKQYKQQGQWGLKRNLPGVIRTGYLQVGQLDTSEHQTPWKAADHDVLFLRRWHANFPHATAHQQQPNVAPLLARDEQSSKTNLAALTPRQFQRFLQHTITPDTLAAIKHALNNPRPTPEQVYDYLNVQFVPERPVPLLGPVYTTSNAIQQDTIVKGRLLNRQQGGYAVGIGGVVALLPNRYAMGLQKPNDRLIVRDFYVRRAHLDEDGKPQVILSLLPKSPNAHIRQKATSLQSLASPTSALPSAPHPDRRHTQHVATNAQPSHWTDLTLDDLFKSSPSTDDLDELQLFLLDQDNARANKHQQKPARTSSHPVEPSTTSSQSAPHHEKPMAAAQKKQHHVAPQSELVKNHSALMNRIISLLKNGSISKKNQPQ
ncbi:hypothetical protein BC940DRAFT_301984 [Gongronella butleri]|nr:hypothetical protein BC940DRAFT_301984 [Gongronella butleri]